MRRTAALVVVMMWMRAPDSDASCAFVPPKPAKLVVDACTTVDTSKLKAPSEPKRYEGIVLEGMLTVGKDKPVRTKVWVPASEKLTCAQVKPTSTVSGTLSSACCDGDPNPPCFIETSSILTKLTVAATVLKPVKQATRAELETEVESLRAQVQKLRAEIDAIHERERKMVEMLQDEKRQLETKLKD